MPLDYSSMPLTTCLEKAYFQDVTKWQNLPILAKHGKVKIHFLGTIFGGFYMATNDGRTTVERQSKPIGRHLCFVLRPSTGRSIGQSPSPLRGGKGEKPHLTSPWMRGKGGWMVRLIANAKANAEASPIGGASSLYIVHCPFVYLKCKLEFALFVHFFMGV